MVDSRASFADDGRRGERLELRVPTTPTQLPAVRAMAGDLAMRMDYDLDSVEDLRLAVDEACAILATVGTAGEPLTVVFETTRDGLHIDAWIPAPEGTTVPRDGFGWAVLQTLVDEVDTGRSSPDAVAPGSGTTAGVAVISMDKLLPRHSQPTGGPDQNMSVAQ